jgi:hypothetical protein
MEQNGFTMQVEDVQDLNAVKDEKQVPPFLRSCHTAVVDGYIIEGHVTVADIERLLNERPDIAGLAVPGMPPGSPGMEVAGGEVAAYDVIAFDASGNTEVYASYGQ